MNMYELCLLHAHSDRALRGYVAAHLQVANITMMEWLLLGVVKRAGAKGCNMSDIAAALQVTLPQVTALVNKLLPLKLIRQKPAANDRRSRLVVLTHKGELVLEESTKVLDEAKQALFAGTPSDTFDAYTATLASLASKSV